MKKIPLFAFAIALLLLFACNDESEEVIIDSSLPQGQFSAQRSGNFMEQNSTGSTGMAEVGTDEDNTSFLRFGNSFSTNFATGTVTVYLSTSMTFTPDPGNGNPDLRLVGPVSKAGENFFKLDPAPAAKFTHVILWCGSANVPFGYAALQ
jgi:hypothetical protein